MSTAPRRADLRRILSDSAAASHPFRPHRSRPTAPRSYGFRYVQLTNFPGTPDEGTFTAHFIHSNVEQTGAFNTDNDLLNNIQHCTRFASLSNLMDVPTDCPQRERRGWLGDAQLSAETTINNFDMAGFYTKWLRDIRDSQEFLGTKGQIPDCVPFYGHGGLPADPACTYAKQTLTHPPSPLLAVDSPPVPWATCPAPPQGPRLTPSSRTG